MTAHCSKCKLDKPMTDFFPDRSRTRGVQSYNPEYNRKWGNAHDDVLILEAAIRYIKGER